MIVNISTKLYSKHTPFFSLPKTTGRCFGENNVVVVVAVQLLFLRKKIPPILVRPPVDLFREQW